MKKLQFAAAAAAMCCLIITLLLSSFQFAVYADPQYQFYEKEYEKYKVTEDLDMKMSDVMEVTDYMMAYLIGEKEELSIVTDVDGKRQDFFNEQDRLHMEDVKNLFLSGLKIRNICLALFLMFAVLLIALKADIKLILPKAYFTVLGVFVVLTAVLGCLFALDFTKYFIIFHEIFFTNDLWSFNPATDYMIRMLPEGFFSDMVWRIGTVFLISLAAVGAVFLIWHIVAGKKNKNDLSKD